MSSRSVLILAVIGFFTDLCAQNIDSAFRVDTIILEGNRRTKDGIIFRELTFSVNDTIQNWKYHSEQSRRQLINLFLFNEIIISHSGDTVRIHVTERLYFWPIPILDYADRNFNQWWLSKDPRRLIYGVDLSWYNIRGRNETMVLNLVMGYTQSIGLSYKMPFINRKKTWGLQLSAYMNANREVWSSTKEDKVVFFTSNDEQLIYRQAAEIVVTNRKKFFSYHHLYTGYRQVRVKDTIVSPEVNPEYLLNGENQQKELYMGYQFVFDKRDYKGFPLNGNLLKLNIEGANFFSSIKDYQTLLIKMAYSRYLQVNSRLYASMHGTLRWYTNEYPQYTHAQALGYGKDYIRGYELNVIDGTHFALGKSELKFRFHNKKYQFLKSLKNYEIVPVSMYFSAFFDAGYVANAGHRDRVTKVNSLPNSLQHGGGVGYNLVLFYDYCMRLEYSADKYLNSRFYVSFVASM